MIYGTRFEKGAKYCYQLAPLRSPTSRGGYMQGMISEGNSLFLVVIPSKRC